MDLWPGWAAFRRQAVIPIALLALCSWPALHARAQNSAPVTSDGAPDKAHPAHLEQMELTSHGATMFGVFYAAAGAGRRPTVLLLHGFPGYEQNMDLAQAIRRAGWNVLTFHYRGAWGSHGDFSFSHAIEDTEAMVAYLRDPAHATRLGVDPARIAVIGHSMGGFMAAYAGAHEKGLAGVALISAWNLGREAAALTPATETSALAEFRSNSGPLAGCTPEGLLAEARRRARDWNMTAFAPEIKAPLLVIDANDGSAQDADAFVAAAKAAGNRQVTEEHFATDHPYSDQRIALETAIIDWLGKLG